MARIKGALEGSYNPHNVEEEIHRFWRNNKIYLKVKEKSSKARRKLYFLDGPPYTSSTNFHIGTAWNKTIKDSFIRFYRMLGYNVWDQPGYDTHGLPIEVKIEKELGIGTKKEIVELGIDRFVLKCMEFARKNLEALSRGFSDLGVFMDWDHPYITFRDSYIESGWWMIKKAHEQGLLKRDLRVHHWCPRCETTLADYEVSEYRELEDPSIYVKFRVKGQDKLYLVIWTTTPWTLPANAFVMAHPDIVYAKVRVGDEVLVMAKSRVPTVMEEAGIKDYEILEELPGTKLEGIEYQHPLEEYVDAQSTLRRYHKVVLASEAVTEYEGTGLVHSAPGHGDVDYEVAKRIGVPVVSLVDDQGRLTSGAGKYKGLYFRESNDVIIKDLESRGALLYKGSIRHKYPVCWRCKTPLVLRATEQWVIKVTELKDKLISEAESIEWRPAWAKIRFLNLLKNVRDWVISRQRFWGIPLPIWVCSKCGHIEVVGGRDDISRLGGKAPENLHRPWIDKVTLKCPVCGGEMKRVPDVADVWFDSGIAFYASLGYPHRKELWSRLKPVDFITEGHDQIRGWFFSLLRSGVITFGEKPYLRVLVHGFALDEHGREMHKSLGNYVEFNEVIKRVGRDVFRWWAMQTTTWEDLRFSWSGMEKVKRDLSIVWNVYNFALTYMGLDGFDPLENPLDRYIGSLKTEDRWILSRLNNVVKEYLSSMHDLKPFIAARLLREFIVEDVSRWYIRLIRRRVWVEEDTEDKRTAYAVLYAVLKSWLILAAPFMPFVTEKLYRELVYNAGDGFESVHLESMPVPREEFINADIEESMSLAKKIIEAALAARMKVGINVRRPVKRVIVALADNKAANMLRLVENVVLEMVNAKHLEIVGENVIESYRIARVEPNYSTIGPEFKKKTKQIVSLIEEKNIDIASSIIDKGFYEDEIEGEKVVIERRHVKVKADYPEWLSVTPIDQGMVAIDTRIDEDEYLEGLARELIRRIQFMRKELGLGIEDNIRVGIESGDNALLKAAARFRDYIAGEVRAAELVLGEGTVEGYVREWDIDGARVRITVAKA